MDGGRACRGCGVVPPLPHHLPHLVVVAPAPGRDGVGGAHNLDAPLDCLPCRGCGQAKIRWDGVSRRPHGCLVGRIACLHFPPPHLCLLLLLGGPARRLQHLDSPELSGLCNPRVHRPRGWPTKQQAEAHDPCSRLPTLFRCLSLLAHGQDRANGSLRHDCHISFIPFAFDWVSL